MTDRIQRARIISRITTWTLRLLVAITIFIFAAMMIIAVLGGHGPMQKSAIENLGQSYFGHRSIVHQLNDYQIFPTFIVDFENMVVLGADDQPLLILERAVYKTDALARFTGRDPIYDLKLQNLLTAPGFFGPYSLHLKDVMIVDQPNVHLHIAGMYGGYDVSADIPMKSSDINGAARYQFLGNQPIKFKINGLGISATMTIMGQDIIFDSVVIGTVPNVISGTLILKPDAKTAAFRLNFTGEDKKFDGTIKQENNKFLITIAESEMSAKNQRQIQSILAPLQVMVQESKQRNQDGSYVPPAQIEWLGNGLSPLK